MRYSISPSTTSRLTLPRKLQEAIWTAGQGATLLAVAMFVFEIAQSWLDIGIDKALLRWILPLSVAGVTTLLLAFLLLFVNFRRRPHAMEPAEALAHSILEYANQLHREGRDQALVTLRNHFSITLHILGFHKIRVNLGELALQSATILENNLIKVQVLIDDLGWANYLLGNRKIAIANIARGVEIARAAKDDKSDEILLWEAKGLRHLALITCLEDRAGAESRLDKAEELLRGIKRHDLTEVSRDLAQIYHARALVRAMVLGVHKEGRLRKGDDDGLNEVKEALRLVRQSAQIFQNIGDRDRYTKALFLEVRLLEAMGAETEALEARALRDRTLASSEWLRPEGTQTLTGVSS